MDKYDDVTLQIRDVIKDDLFDSRQSFDDEKQKEVVEILRNNFNIKDEEMGRALTRDVWMFDPESGYEFDVPLFAAPLLLPLGVIIIKPEKFPNYDVDNKYIGYTENGRFYRMDFMGKFIYHARKDRMTYIMFFLLAYLLVAMLITLFAK